MTSIIDEMTMHLMPLIPSDNNIVITLDAYSGPDKYFGDDWLADRFSEINITEEDITEDAEVCSILTTLSGHEHNFQLGFPSCKAASEEPVHRKRSSLCNPECEQVRSSIFSDKTLDELLNESLQDFLQESNRNKKRSKLF